MPDRVIELRPQPVGIYPGAAALLLLPRAADASALDAILRGARLDADAPALNLPPEWRFWDDARLGDATPASRQGAMLEGGAAAEDGGALARYNQFVLAPSAPLFRALAAELTGALRELLAVAAYATGVADRPPADTPSLDGELLALARATGAAWYMEQGAVDDAAAELDRAIAAAGPMSPAFTVQLLGQRATLRDEVAVAASDLQRALDIAKTCASRDLVAGLWMELGLLYQERGGRTRGVMTEAVKAYQEAIHAGYDASRHPDQYGQLQNNIGLAHLATPMVEASDQLRFAVAVQSFREASRMFTREASPGMWSSTQLNMANALQYLPSSHPAENLGKAVEIYEAVLQARDRENDPVGYARVLANQANALAHLGGLTVALAKFREARGLAARAGAADLADGISGEIDRIEAHRLKPSRQNAEPRVESDLLHLIPGGRS